MQTRTLLANMDIWSSAQGVYIFVGTNDISVVRCDAHTELHRALNWHLERRFAPGKVVSLEHPNNELLGVQDMEDMG